MIRLALYQPEIPQNTGTLMRLGACLNVPLEIIEPCGFIYDDKRLKRSGMDYREIANVTRHGDFETFMNTYSKARKVLIDVKGDHNLYDFTFEEDDILLLGQESQGVPDFVFSQCEKTLKIPMVPHCRSLNVAIAGSMVLSTAIQQLRHKQQFYEFI